MEPVPRGTPRRGVRALESRASCAEMTDASSTPLATEPRPASRRSVPGGSTLAEPAPWRPAPAWRAWLPLLVAAGVFVVVLPLTIRGAPSGGPPVEAPTDPAAPKEDDFTKEAVRLGLTGLISLGAGALSLFVGRREYAAEIGDVKRRLSRLEDDSVPEDRFGTLEARVDRTEGHLRQDVGALHEKINVVAQGLSGTETEVRAMGKWVEAIAVKLKIKAVE